MVDIHLFNMWKRYQVFSNQWQKNAYIYIYLNYIFARTIYTIVQTIRALYKLHFNAYIIKYTLYSIFEFKFRYEKLEIEFAGIGDNHNRQILKFQ